MAVISVRVPDELKEKMKKYDINWSEEIRRFIASRISKEEKRRTVEMMHELLAGGIPAKEGTAKRYVREDRDGN
ncbi:type II toxin-antitoxin system VapB family antitoxin [Thermococcus camini]|uniref:Antitoxin n=1 Tax=Thermococcus camini TaxID=2016373 RepID=A0A7G2D6Y2_9EURY|nr:hypothetical protein [Thermococcus camini]CAD5244193.1 conserved protein of unknown function [Thermococcus camini]